MIAPLALAALGSGARRAGGRGNTICDAPPFPWAPDVEPAHVVVDIAVDLRVDVDLSGEVYGGGGEGEGEGVCRLGRVDPRAWGGWLWSPGRPGPWDQDARRVRARYECAHQMDGRETARQRELLCSV
jgi:hypothetical protein